MLTGDGRCDGERKDVKRREFAWFFGSSTSRLYRLQSEGRGGK